MSGKQQAIDVRDVSFWYDGDPVLENVTLTVSERDMLGLVGPNGGGKTTLLRLILGLLEPQQGEILVLGKPPREVRHMIGYVPQYLDMDRTFPVTVEDVVLMGRLSESRAFWRFGVKDREAASLAMREVEIEPLRRKRIDRLSGGERQRMLIARALAGNPRILLLDEPTSNVDTMVQKEIYDLLRRINETVTVVLVSHDIAFVSSYVKSVACLNRRLACHPASDVTGEIIAECYSAPVRIVRHHERP
jgi:zinc transport system ATP-binding protein